MNSLDNSKKNPADKAKKRANFTVIEAGAEPAEPAPSQEHEEPAEQNKKPIKLDCNDTTLRTCQLWLKKHEIELCYSAYNPVGYVWAEGDKVSSNSNSLVNKFISRNQHHNKELVRACFDIIAEEAPIYNPVINALEALPELPDPSHNYYADLAKGVSDDLPLAAEAIGLWLRQGVAAPYNGIDGNEDNLFSLPYVLLLMGLQGGGKTTFFAKCEEALAGARYFSQLPTIPTEDERDRTNTLLSSHIVELGEFSAITGRRRNEEIKFELSKRQRSYRPQRGREIPPFPVRQIFGGTTNAEKPLADPTGNRRFLPVWVKDNFEDFVLSDDCLLLMKYCWKQAYNEVMQIYAAEGQKGLPRAFEPTKKQKEAFKERAFEVTYIPYADDLAAIYRTEVQKGFDGEGDNEFNLAIWGRRDKNYQWQGYKYTIKTPAEILLKLLQVKNKYPSLQGLNIMNIKPALERMDKEGMIHRERDNSRAIKYSAIKWNDYLKEHPDAKEQESTEEPAKAPKKPEVPKQQDLPYNTDIQDAVNDCL